ARVQIWMPPFLVAHALADGGEQRMRMCVPDALLGAAQRLTATLWRESTPCGDELRELSVDEGCIVNDPACTSSGGAIDGGFESLLSPLGWFAYRQGSSVAVVEGAELAHSGDGVIEITSRCSRSGIERWIVAPPAGPEGGPALRFWHDTPDLTAVSAKVNVANPLPTIRTLPEGGGWTEEVVCLDPELAGLLTLVEVYLVDGSGMCDETQPPESMRVDDISIGPDPRCPIE